MKIYKLSFVGMLFILAQSCFTSPTSNTELHNCDHEFNKENKLYKIALKDFVERLIPFCKRYIDLLEQAVEDLKTNKNTAKYEHVKKQLDLVSIHFEHFKDSSPAEAFKGFLKFERSISGHGSTVEDVFSKHGSEDFVEQFCQSFLEYFDDFVKNFISCAKSLSEAENVDHTNVLEWFKSFREEEDCGDKFEMFKQFFMFFNPQLFAEED